MGVFLPLESFLEAANTVAWALGLLWALANRDWLVAGGLTAIVASACIDVAVFGTFISPPTRAAHALLLCALILKVNDQTAADVRLLERPALIIVASLYVVQAFAEAERVVFLAVLAEALIFSFVIFISAACCSEEGTDIDPPEKQTVLLVVVALHTALVLLVAFVDELKPYEFVVQNAYSALTIASVYITYHEFGNQYALF